MGEAYDVSQDAKPVIGSLIDDWENLEKLITENNSVAFLDLDRLASILRAISQELNPV
jgi:hypothetical protein